MQRNNHTEVVFDNSTAPENKRSSNVEAIEYDSEHKILTVTFKGRRMYEYSDVPRQIVEGIKTAHSVGGFIYSHIRDQYKVSEI